MRVLVMGRSGQLAMALAERASMLDGINLLTLGRPEIDLERPAELAAHIFSVKPDLIVNAAAFTSVDLAEVETRRAFAVNEAGAAAVALAARTLGIPLIHLSTDYVFNGRKGAPYSESDLTDPLGTYGRSKLAGEQAVMAIYPDALIIRTSWVFGPFGSNFLKTMLHEGARRSVMRVVDDQAGSPTSALELAAAILRIAPGLRGEAGGIYHLSGGGSASRFEFAAAIFAESMKHGGPSPRLEAIKTRDYPARAPRPADSSLDCSAFSRRFGFALSPWAEAVPPVVERVLFP